MTSKSIIKLFVLIAIAAQFVPVADASIYRLDFSGNYETVSGDTGSYSGFVLIDFSAPDLLADQDLAIYDAVVDAHLQVDDVTWVLDLVPGNFSFVGVSDDHFATDDTFQVTVGLANVDDSIDTAMTLRFIDPDRMVLSSDSLPTLAEFESFELDTFFDSATNIVIPVGVIPGNNLEPGTVLTATLRPVPLPSAIVLLLSALFGYCCLRGAG